MRFFVQSAANLASTVGRAPARRCLATSSSLRKDLVQDLYLRELKAYKPVPAAKDAHVGAVREFKAPQAPAIPTLSGDVAAELSAYASSEPTLAPRTAEDGKDAATEGKLSGPALLKFLEEDLPKDDLHHH